jgi:hypothetical protein
MHVCPAAQVVPQAPQFDTWVITSTQSAPHCLSPVAQLATHAPLEHTCPVGHAMPQLPQLAALDCVSTQLDPQSVSPERH